MITIIVEQLPEGVWLATSPDLAGLVVEMPTKHEAIAEAQRVAADLLALRPPYEIGSGGTIPLWVNLTTW